MRSSSSMMPVVYLVERFEENPEQIICLFERFLIEKYSEKSKEEINKIANRCFIELLKSTKNKKEKYFVPFLEMNIVGRKIEEYIKVIYEGLLKYHNQLENYMCNDPLEIAEYYTFSLGVLIEIKRALKTIGYETHEDALEFCKRAVRNKEFLDTRIELMESVCRFTGTNTLEENRVVKMEDFFHAFDKYKQELQKIELVKYMKSSFIAMIATYQTLAFFQKKGFWEAEFPSTKDAQEMYGVDFGAYRESKKIRSIDIMLVDLLVTLIRDYL